MYVSIWSAGDRCFTLDVTGDDYDPLIYKHYEGYIRYVIYQRYDKYDSISEIYTVSIQQTGKR